MGVGSPTARQRPPALLGHGWQRGGYSPTLWPVLLEVSKSSALISETRAWVSACCGCRMWPRRLGSLPESPLGHGCRQRAARGPVQGSALPSPRPSWPRACLCQDMPCPGRSLAEPGPHRAGSPGAWSHRICCGTRARAEPLTPPRHTWMQQLHPPPRPPRTWC